MKKQIEADISTNDVFVFMKGTPASPQCGFSNMACRVLDAYGAGVRVGALAHASSALCCLGAQGLVFHCMASWWPGMC